MGGGGESRWQGDDDKEIMPPSPKTNLSVKTKKKSSSQTVCLKQEKRKD